MHVLEADIIKVKKNFDFMSLAQRMHFLHDVFQMTAISFVLVWNHYHINGLNLFWDTLYTHTHTHTHIYIYIYIYICRNSNLLPHIFINKFILIKDLCVRKLRMCTELLYVNWPNIIIIIIIIIKSSWSSQISLNLSLSLSLSKSNPIIHHSRVALQTTPSVRTELM